MARKTEAPIRAAAERAAAEVYELVQRSAYEAAVKAAQDAIYEAAGVTIPVEDISLDDRMTRAEAARRLGTTQQTIIRLEAKGAVRPEKSSDGRVYVRLSEVEDALHSGAKGVMARSRARRGS